VGASGRIVAFLIYQNRVYQGWICQKMDLPKMDVSKGEQPIMNDKDVKLRELIRNFPLASGLPEEDLQNISHVEQCFINTEYQGFMRDVVFKVRFIHEGIWHTSYYVLFIEWSEEISPQLYKIISDEAVHNLNKWHNKDASPEDQDPAITPFLYKAKLKEDAKAKRKAKKKGKGR
jgi:hypothetical protein